MRLIAISGLFFISASAGLAQVIATCTELEGFTTYSDMMGEWSEDQFSEAQVSLFLNRGGFDIRWGDHNSARELGQSISVALEGDRKVTLYVGYMSGSELYTFDFANDLVFYSRHRQGLFDAFGSYVGKCE
ncbi:hypothetical protein [Histidinibacterium aquaticum]|uniref:Uncharacterized protein n=1 Tax=Histidinibacterium aquaticum TaxID=2613962 RepID=A0A5J5GSK1_9RHOB|nr:hypothetical protein [Histidinibacterium aquaticum]KAA9010332.1 hypothetical protein F3S47_03545 [Histidinibacterium aquaticum]